MYWAIVFITLILGFISQGWISHNYKKYSNIPSGVPVTGADMAAGMLAAYGVQGVQINVIEGTLTDNFDPTQRQLNLSTQVAYGTSIAAHAVACHEAGHCLQLETGYGPLALRKALVPITNFSSIFSWIIILVGIFAQSAGLLYIGAACYFIAFIFSVVTLPVEFNASKRAIAYLDGQNGVLNGYAVYPIEKTGTRAMLRSAAFTYVAATLASFLNLLYVLFLANSSS